MIRLILLILFLIPSLSFAADYPVTCSGTITSALQSALTSAGDGDTVTIGSGSCTAGAVSFANKNITVQGGGIGTTTIASLALTITATTKASWRITGMTLSAGRININSQAIATSIKGFRIDHIAWTYASCGQNIAIWITGQAWGLIDQCTFNNAGNAIFVSGYTDASGAQGYETTPWPPDGDPGMGGHGWGMALNQGSDEAVYIEDCEFTLAADCFYGVTDNYYGSRQVFRYNTVTNAYWQNHAARGYERGGNINAEIYNNDFNATDSDWYRAIHIRSGTGVVFNNTIRGYFTQMNADNQRSDGSNNSAPYLACDGSHAWDMNTTGGWPCLDQIGRGPGVAWGLDQDSVPLYIWNNGSDAGCHTGGSCSNNRTMTNTASDAAVVAGRDYINNGTMAKSGYTPYTYPHPLRDEGVADVTAPTLSNLSPSGNISYQTTTQLSLNTDEAASCRYHASSVTWAEMSAMSNTGGTTHIQAVAVSVGENTFKVVCQDPSTNESDAGTWSFTVAAEPPAPPPGTYTIGTGGTITKGGGGGTITYR